MTTYTMLHDVPAVRAAIAERKPIEWRGNASGCIWIKPSISDVTPDAGLRFYLEHGELRISSPSRQARGSQVVSGDVTLPELPKPACDDMCVPCADPPGYEWVEAYTADQMHAYARAAASALLARRPAQGASTPTAWPTRDACRKLVRDLYDEWSRGTDAFQMLEHIGDGIHTRYFAAGGRDGEGS